MANPNIAGSSLKIFGVTDYLTPGGTTALVLLPNSPYAMMPFKKDLSNDSQIPHFLRPHSDFLGENQHRGKS
jgi:hypothetical protein